MASGPVQTISTIEAYAEWRLGYLQARDLRALLRADLPRPLPIHTLPIVFARDGEALSPALQAVSVASEARSSAALVLGWPAGEEGRRLAAAQNLWSLLCVEDAATVLISAASWCQQVPTRVRRRAARSER